MNPGHHGSESVARPGVEGGVVELASEGCLGSPEIAVVEDASVVLDEVEIGSVEVAPFESGTTDRDPGEAGVREIAPDKEDVSEDSPHEGTGPKWAVDEAYVVKC